MQEIRSSNSPVVTGICDLNKSRARRHRSLKHGLKLKYFKKKLFVTLNWEITKFGLFVGMNCYLKELNQIVILRIVL